jgi:hypothetical protein
MKSPDVKYEFLLFFFLQHLLTANLPLFDIAGMQAWKTGHPNHEGFAKK